MQRPEVNLHLLLHSKGLEEVGIGHELVAQLGYAELILVNGGDVAERIDKGRQVHLVSEVGDALDVGMCFPMGLAIGISDSAATVARLMVPSLHLAPEQRARIVRVEKEHQLVDTVL